MKRTCALLMSFVLLAAQFYLGTTRCSAGVAPATMAAKLGCCAPAKLACAAACCVKRAAAPHDTSTPTPATDHGPRVTPLALLAALWTLPAPAALPASFSAPSPDAVPAPALPLFLRDAALLI